MSDKLCRGGNIARFTRPVLPTLHCGDPACVCMGAPIPEALDLDALKQKALAAKGTDEKARWYAKETPDKMFSAQEYHGRCSDAAVTRRALADACTADVILALLTAAQQGAEDRALLDELLDDVLFAMREPMVLADAREARSMLTRVSVSRKKAKVRAARAAQEDATNGR